MSTISVQVLQNAYKHFLHYIGNIVRPAKDAACQRLDIVAMHFDKPRKGRQISSLGGFNQRLLVWRSHPRARLCRF
ncbi:MAG TPA: hypothetical protein VMM76_20375 [Pirellulaceae bacterium]|nr:hypothetical protein [Pirellulaceae bacterium]